MQWEKLLSAKRFKKSSGESYIYDERNEFDKDYSRIISSSSFRRLQDKTQVFPLKRGDFVRTRLTHSLEVSHIASSMGKYIEAILERKDQKISSILSVAGLIHDLGNPPFGHSGEYVIQDFFREYFSKSELNFTEIQKRDLEYFDGNVQTLRILRRLQYLGDEFGYNLTYATLATIIKYPMNSVEGNKKDSKKIEKKKFGYFKSEEEDYLAIAKELGIKNKRHPLTYILEAADDIAYSVADIEDGIQKKLISLYEVEELLEELKDEEANRALSKLEEFKEKNKDIKTKSLYEKVIIQKLKIFIQGRMIQEAIETFLENEKDILKGKFNKELLDCGRYKKIKDGFKDLAKRKVFLAKERVYTDILANRVLRKLLEIFIEGSLECLEKGKEASIISRNIMRLISENHMVNYEREMKKSKTKEDKIYTTLKLCVDFISGMTDQFAVDLYKKLEGIE